MELDTPYIRLDCAALHLARDVYPDICVPRYLRLLDELAGAVAARRPGLAATLRYEAMRAVLVDAFGLRGNAENYYDPQNSYVNRVLDCGVGVPISLSLIWIEVARRLKWPVAGVALPGHFMVRFDDPERYVLADPFHGGISRSLQECRTIVKTFDGALRLRPHHLKPVNTRSLLARLLRNLRNIYLAVNDLPRVASVLRRLAAVEPHNGQHLQELAAVCTRMGDVRGALAHLSLYLERQPNAGDRRLVRRSVHQLEAALLALN